jgi:hypothetical protein
MVFLQALTTAAQPLALLLTLLSGAPEHILSTTVLEPLGRDLHAAYASPHRAPLHAVRPLVVLTQILKAAVPLVSPDRV